jgi:mannonate dehydratase
MIQLSELLSPRPDPLLHLVKQCGVDNVVALLKGAEQEQRMFKSVGAGSSLGFVDNDEVPWSEESIARDKAMFADYGLKMVAIEDTAPMEKVRLGLDGRDEQIDNIITQVRAMGHLEIPVLCYNWMAISAWARTSIDIESRGGALVTGFSLTETEALPPIVKNGEVTTEQLWGALSYFLDAVVPVAEEAGVRLALHPDDPPVPVVRGMPRIMSSVESFRRLLALRPSASNAMTLCQGNFALMTDDLPGVIREFGAADAVAFVHFRDVKGSADDFVETFHDNGQTDMLECMRAYAEIGFSGPMRADHVPTMYGETNDRPGYGTLGRLFAMGYIRGLEQSVYGRR